MKLKCVCYDIPIEDIVEAAEFLGIESVEEVISEMGICDKCRLCNKYIEMDLKDE